MKNAFSLNFLFINQHSPKNVNFLPVIPRAIFIHVNSFIIVKLDPVSNGNLTFVSSICTFTNFLFTVVNAFSVFVELTVFFYFVFFSGFFSTLLELIIFTEPSARAGYDTRSIFKRSLTGLDSECSFS